MPINRLRPSGRATAAIVAITSVAVGGYVTLFKGEPPVHDDTALAAQYLVQPWEGRKLVAYYDTLAKPHVWTICDGDTIGVTKGMVETQAGCNKRLASKMEKLFRPKVAACIAGFDRKPISWRAMMLSLAWNIGTVATCNSTAAAKGKLGDYVGSCNAATAFNKAGGRVIIGLVHRRENGDATRIGEGEMCVSGVK